MTQYSAALEVAISQATYASGENHERAVLRQLLGGFRLNGVLGRHGFCGAAEQRSWQRLEVLVGCGGHGGGWGDGDFIDWETTGT
jgi:hypothetical protein